MHLDCATAAKPWNAVLSLLTARRQRTVWGLHER